MVAGRDLDPLPAGLSAGQLRAPAEQPGSLRGQARWSDANEHRASYNLILEATS